MKKVSLIFLICVFFAGCDGLKEAAYPNFSIESGSYDSAQELTLLSSDDNTEIYYTLDGTEPTKDSFKYDKPIIINKSMQVRAVGFLLGQASEVVEFSYILQCQPVEFSVEPGVYPQSISVELSTLTADSEIFYTLDGSEPDADSEKYSVPLSVDSSCVVKAISLKEGWENSEAVVADYTITGRIPQPVVSVVTGTYFENQTVEISCADSEAVIYYTIDSSTPGLKSKKYTGAFEVDSSSVVQAYAVKNLWLDSQIAVSEITLKCSPVICDLDSGTYTGERNVNLSSSVDGAEIFYTLDNLNPTASSQKYSTAITISDSLNLKAICSKAGWEDSEILTREYTIMHTAATPVLSEESGTFDEPFYLSFTSSEASGEIFYTLNEDTPDSSSNHYTTPVLIDKNVTVKAVCVKEDFINSPVVSRSYEFVCPEPSVNLEEVPEKNKPAILSLDGSSDDFNYYYTLDGTPPTTGSFLLTDPVEIKKSCTLKIICTRNGWTSSNVLERNIELICSTPEVSTKSGVYNAPLTVTFGNTEDYGLEQKIFYTLDDNDPNDKSSFVIPGNSITISESAKLKAYFMREGWTNSSMVEYDYSFKANAPAINQDSEITNVSKTISITSDESNVSIYYTIDGNAPTLSSIKYEAPFVISQNREVKALAVYNSDSTSISDITEASYSIKCATPEISVASGTFESAIEVSFSSATPGVKFYYTTDYKIPTLNSNYTENKLTIDKRCTLKVIAVKDNCLNSGVSSRIYNFKCQDLICLNKKGSYEDSLELSMSCGTEGSSIYYTLDGTDPDKSSSVYTAPFVLDSGSYINLKAIARKDGYSSSNQINSYFYKVYKEIISNESFIYAQYIEVDRNNKCHLLYFAMESDTSLKLMYMNNIFGYWSTPEVVMNSLKISLYLSFEIDNSNFAHIAFIEKNGNLYYITNKTGEWSKQQLANDCKLDEGSAASLGLDSNGSVYIAFSHGKNLTLIDNSSGNWHSSDIAVSDNTSCKGFVPSLKLDSNDKIHIISFSEEDERLHYYSNSSGIWTNDVVIDKLAIGWENDFVLDENNNIIVGGAYNTEHNSEMLFCADNSSGSFVIDEICNYGNLSWYKHLFKLNDGRNVVFFNNGWNYSLALKVSGNWKIFELLSIDNYPISAFDVDSNNIIHFVYFNTGNVVYQKFDAGILF